MEIQKNVLLSDHTTIALGGTATQFINCADKEILKSALEYASLNNMKFVVFSGGSNIIFPDGIFDSLVLRINLKGIKYFEDEKYFYADVNAGESWDEFVSKIIEEGYSGIECLSGIPGSVGATPVQNVGAYGQEVSETIESVTAIDRQTLREITFTNKECGFGYRTSRFKMQDKDKFIIEKVLFRFEKNKQPEIKYRELQQLLETNSNYSEMGSLKNKLKCIRNNVISLREKKSMVIRKEDINSRSCGSFFTNPVLSKPEMESFRSLTIDYNDVPVYQTGSEYKISAAWLVEKSGFVKGFRKGGVGISSNHSLALINVNGTAKELLEFSSEIERTVKEKFGIQLVKEPVVVSSE